MSERVTGTTKSCLDCPHRLYRDCGKTDQSIAYWLKKDTPPMPDECPLPKWPKFKEPTS